MRLIHFEDYAAECPEYSADFSITTDPLDTTSCPACLRVARADAIEAWEVATHVMTHHAVNPACRFCTS